MKAPEYVVPYTIDERKRLGQYFTGERLARVLAAISNATRAQSVIDPMAGSGDMLVAAHQIGASAQLTAVEIDQIAAMQCKQRIRDLDRKASVLVGNAFAPSTWASAAEMAWDLVITNPPYVRYQRTTHGATGRVSAPSATDVREGLLQIIANRESLAPDERTALSAVASGYSGLADLAVPSWILCSSLVAPGGRLAMIVPDTWLSRNYALPVVYVLRRFFDLEYVIEDYDAKWFEDALVRTTLVVARRVRNRESGLKKNELGYVYAQLSSEAADQRSLVGALHPSSPIPELAFAEKLHDVASTRQGFEGPGLNAAWTDDQHLQDQLHGQADRAPWLLAVEHKTHIHDKHYYSANPQVPRQLREILDGIETDLCTLADLGWQVGQGLRTGANRFFYAECLGQANGATKLAMDPALAEGPLIVPDGLLRIVVRKQQDLLDSGGDPIRSPGRLIALGSYALPEDIVAASRAGISTPYEPIPEPLANFIRHVAQIDIGPVEAPRRIPDLSAVVTNIRMPDPSLPNRIPRFWYQLPAFAPRHSGVLFIPRVNHHHPLTMVNPNGVIIDANFSTLWHEKSPLISPYALAALLHSTWALLAMESCGTVLGGGALKIEATQLRRLPLPRLTVDAISCLETLGHALNLRHKAAAGLRNQIDSVVWSCISPSVVEKAANFDLLRRGIIRARNPRVTE